MHEVTRILSTLESDQPQASERLLQLVYDELRELAAQRLALEKPGQTLQATALVHEAYLRLVDTETVRVWDNRGHFFAAAAEAMRRILVEQARHRARFKHGGGHRRVPLAESDVAETVHDDTELLRLDEALTRLAVVRPDAAELVKLRFFSGLTAEQAAPLVGLSPRSARRLWSFARAWLRRDMERLGGEVH